MLMKHHFKSKYSNKLVQNRKGENTKIQDHPHRIHSLLADHISQLKIVPICNTAYDCIFFLGNTFEMGLVGEQNHLWMKRTCICCEVAHTIKHLCGGDSTE